MFRNAMPLFFAAVLIGCNGGAAPATPPPAPSTPTPGAPAPDSPSPGAPGNGAEAVTVSVENIAFQTDSVTVEPGTEVQWVNNDAVGHTVTHGQNGVPADDAVIDEPHPVGETVTFAFDESGTYPITCTIHPQMNMTVDVE